MQSQYPVVEAVLIGTNPIVSPFVQHTNRGCSVAQVSTERSESLGPLSFWRRMLIERVWERFAHLLSVCRFAEAGRARRCSRALPASGSPEVRGRLRRLWDQTASPNNAGFLRARS